MIYSPVHQFHWKSLNKISSSNQHVNFNLSFRRQNTMCPFGLGWNSWNAHLRFSLFFFFLYIMHIRLIFFFSVYSLLRLLFMNNSRKVWLFSTFSAQISLFSNFFIKNGSHETIHTFKNYFTTIFFSFQFLAVSKQTLYQKNLRLVLKDSKSLLQLILTKSQGNSTLHKWKFNTKFNGHKKLQKVTRFSWLAQEVYLLLKENVGN